MGDSGVSRASSEQRAVMPSHQRLSCGSGPFKAQGVHASMNRGRQMALLVLLYVEAYLEVREVEAGARLWFTK